MADKRISQLIDRGVVVNNDVIPIVVSGAVTTNKATISSIQTFMQSNLDVGVTSVGITLGSSGTDVNVTGSPVTSSGNITINFPTASATNRGLLSSANWSTFNSKVSSVGLSMPSAFSVANSPITGSGTIAVTGAGTVSQYIRGDGSLADFPAAGGGGSSVSYYLNGSVSQGTIGGIAYQEMNKVPVLGAGTDFVAIADGYLASFITDAGDPALLNIPAGNWNFETYFSASSAGGTPSFYIELYKVDSGGTATLIASNSATPELIAFGTTITPYFSALAVPSTVLTTTDRLALRYFVSRSGRTITLHTENSHLCQIITTFTTGLTALNGLTAQVQNLATGTSGTDFGISSSVSTHTFNLPDASASARGVVTTGTQTIAGAKTFNSSVTANSLIKSGGTSSQFLKADGSVDSTAYNTGTVTSVGLSSATSGVTIGSTPVTTSGTITLAIATASGSGQGLLSSTDWSTFNNKQSTITLTTTGTSGAATLVGATLNIPNYGSALSGYLPLAGGTLTGALNGTSASFSGNVVLSGSDSRFNGGDSVGRLILSNSNTTTYIGLYGATHPTIPYVMSFVVNSAATLTLASTGAATFSSSVTAGGQTSVLYAGYDSNAEGLRLGADTSYYNAISATFSSTAANNKMNFVVNSGNGTRAIAMTLQGNGNVGIGTASPQGRVESKTDNVLAGDAIYSKKAFVANIPYNTANLTSTLLAGYDGSIHGADIGYSYDSAGYYMALATNDNTTGSPIERMRITSGGNVLIGTTTDNGSKLNINGSIALPHVTKSANYTLDGTDYTVGFDCASNRTANLPDSTTCAGRIYVIYQYNTGSGARSVTLDGNGSQTINGSTTYSLSPYCDFSSVMIQSNGSNWIIISSNFTSDCL